MNMKAILGDKLKLIGVGIVLSSIAYLFWYVFQEGVFYMMAAVTLGGYFLKWKQGK